MLQSSRSPGSIDSRGLDGVAVLNPGSAARAAERRVEGIGKSGPSADAGRVGDGLVAVAGNGKAGAVGKPAQLEPDVEDVLRRNRKTPTPDSPTRRAPTDPGRRRHWSDRPPAARPPRSIAARTIRTWRRRRASRCCSTTRRWHATSRRFRAARRAVARRGRCPLPKRRVRCQATIRPLRRRRERRRRPRGATRPSTRTGLAGARPKPFA